MITKTIKQPLINIIKTKLITLVTNAHQVDKQLIVKNLRKNAILTITVI